MEKAFKIPEISSSAEEESELTSLTQIKDKLKNENYNFSESIDTHGKNLEINFKFIDPETKEDIEGKIIFFQIDNRFFYRLGENTLPEDCDEILKKLKKFTNLELYI